MGERQTWTWVADNPLIKGKHRCDKDARLSNAEAEVRRCRARIKELESRIKRASARIPGLCPLCEEALIQVRDLLAGKGESDG